VVTINVPCFALLVIQTGDKEKIKILDCTWSLDNPKFAEEYVKSRIPKAVFFNIDEIKDKNTKLPHMIPPPKQFEQQVEELGISNEDHIICYDRSPSYLASCRVWWTFKLFGHDSVSVLEGALGAWKSKQQLETSPPNATHKKGKFKATFRKELVQTLEDMLENVKNEKRQVVDARSPGRFVGADPEPRPGVKGGHIPNSFNLMVADLVNKLADDQSHFRSMEDMRNAYKNKNIDLDKPISTICGSGVTASVLVFTLNLLGHKNWSVYDGSWTEWGGRDDTPISKEPSK